MEEHFVQGRRYLKPDPNLFGYKVATGRAWPITSDEWTLYKDLQSVPNHSQKMSRPEEVVKEGLLKHVTSFFSSSKFFLSAFFVSFVPSRKHDDHYWAIKSQGRDSYMHDPPA